MSRYWIGRVAQALPLLVLVSAVGFAVLHFSPGDPSTLLADPADLTDQQRLELRASLGLDEPLPVQYVKTIGGAPTPELRGFRSTQTTTPEVRNPLPAT